MERAKGHSVLFVRADALLAELGQARADRSYDKVFRRYLAPDLVILDDFGLRRLTSRFRQRVSAARRHRKFAPNDSDQSRVNSATALLACMSCLPYPVGWLTFWLLIIRVFWHFRGSGQACWRPGKGGHRPPRVSSESAISAWAVLAAGLADHELAAFGEDGSAGWCWSWAMSLSVIMLDVCG